jgi:hypothetical protein
MRWTQLTSHPTNTVWSGLALRTTRLIRISDGLYLPIDPTLSPILFLQAISTLQYIRSPSSLILARTGDCPAKNVNNICVDLSSTALVEYGN